MFLQKSFAVVAFAAALALALHLVTWFSLRGARFPAGRGLC